MCNQSRVTIELEPQQARGCIVHHASCMCEGHVPRCMHRSNSRALIGYRYLTPASAVQLGPTTIVNHSCNCSRWVKSSSWTTPNSPAATGGNVLIVGKNSNDTVPHALRPTRVSSGRLTFHEQFHSGFRRSTSGQHQHGVVWLHIIR